LLAFPWNGKWLALVATADDGHHRYFNPDPNAGMDVVAGIWDPGHTSIAPFEFGGDEGLLLLHPEEGVLRFARFTEYGQPFDVIFEVPVPFEATHVRSFESEGVSTVVLYDAVTGTIETGRFGEVEEGVGYFPRETRVTQERLTELVPVTYDGVPHALTLSAETGVLHLRSLDPLEDSPIIVK
jgi:hypothetical protein